MGGVTREDRGGNLKGIEGRFVGGKERKETGGGVPGLSPKG